MTVRPGYNIPSVSPSIGVYYRTSIKHHRCLCGLGGLGPVYHQYIEPNEIEKEVSTAFSDFALYSSTLRNNSFIL